MRVYECISGNTKVVGVFSEQHVKLEDENGVSFKLKLQELPKIMETFEQIIEDFGLEKE